MIDLRPTLLARRERRNAPRYGACPRCRRRYLLDLERPAGGYCRECELPLRPVSRAEFIASGDACTGCVPAARLPRAA